MGFFPGFIENNFKKGVINLFKNIELRTDMQVSIS